MAPILSSVALQLRLQHDLLASVSLYCFVMTILSALAAENDKGTRLDRFLSEQFETLSRSRAKTSGERRPCSTKTASGTSRRAGRSPRRLLFQVLNILSTCLTRCRRIHGAGRYSARYPVRRRASHCWSTNPPEWRCTRRRAVGKALWSMRYCIIAAEHCQALAASNDRALSIALIKTRPAYWSWRRVRAAHQGSEQTCSPFTILTGRIWLWCAVRRRPLERERLRLKLRAVREIAKKMAVVPRPPLGDMPITHYQSHSRPMAKSAKSTGAPGSGTDRVST